MHDCLEMLEAGYRGQQAQGRIRLRLNLAAWDGIMLKSYPGALSRIFEPFFTNLGVQGRHGLGPYLVWLQVTGLPGGTIAGSSRHGLGTRMELVLPKLASAPAGSG
jgi:hypothetical protein